MDLTLTIPDELASRLRTVEDRLPEILELGLREWHSSPPGYAGLNDLLETLARLPSPEEVHALSDPRRLFRTVSKNCSPRTAPGDCRTTNEGNGSTMNISSTLSVWPRSERSNGRPTGERP